MVSNVAGQYLAVSTYVIRKTKNNLATNLHEKTRIAFGRCRRQSARKGEQLQTLAADQR
jgi:hypothetical protein